MHSVLLFFVISGSWPNPLDWPWRGMQCGLCLISVEEKTLHQLLKRYHFPHEVDTKNDNLKSGLLLLNVQAWLSKHAKWLILPGHTISCRLKPVVVGSELAVIAIHAKPRSTTVIQLFSLLSCRRYRYIWKTWLSTLIMDTRDAPQEKCS